MSAVSLDLHHGEQVIVHSTYAWFFLLAQRTYSTYDFDVDDEAFWLDEYFRLSE